jgi:hypothetical protein
MNQYVRVQLYHQHDVSLGIRIVGVLPARPPAGAGAPPSPNSDVPALQGDGAASRRATDTLGNARGCVLAAGKGSMVE